MHNTTTRDILIQEALRSMAFLGMMMFGGILAIELFIPLSNTAFFALLLLPPLLYFPIGVWFRLRRRSALAQPSPGTVLLRMGAALVASTFVVFGYVVTGQFPFGAAVLSTVLGIVASLVLWYLFTRHHPAR